MKLWNEPEAKERVRDLLHDQEFYDWVAKSYDDNIFTQNRLLGLHLVVYPLLILRPFDCPFSKPRLKHRMWGRRNPSEESCEFASQLTG